MPTVVASRPNPAVQFESPECQRLAAMIGKMGFGLIEDLLVVRGQPQFTPKPRCTRVFNLTAEGTQDAKRSGREYRLRTMDALFRRLDSIQEPATISILVKHGLPARLSLKEPVEA